MIRSIIIFFIILTNVTFAEIKKITIVGNARVSSATIESLVDKKISNIDTIYINNLTKKIYDTDFFADVKIYPNPASDVVFVRTPSGSQIRSVELYSMNGQRFTSSVAMGRIDVSALAPGLYILQLNVDGKLSQTRITLLP